MRKIPAVFATLALAGLGAVIPATGAQAATNCETAYQNALPGYFYIYANPDCNALLARTTGNDANWGDASGPVQGVDVGKVRSLLHKGTSGMTIKLYKGPDYTGADVCLTRSESYVRDLDGSTFPDGTPLASARSHKWTWTSDCDRFLD